jgi:TetR/AcrR family transcriptional repressor of nem operon
MDDLVRETGASRQAIYQSFGGKRALFVACLDHYREAVVTPAFGRVEQPGSSLSEIEAYFEFQIAKAESGGLPGPGCLFVNTMTEVAPHDPDIEVLTSAHCDRLQRGFAAALGTRAQRDTPTLLVSDLASVLTVGSHGLWSLSRQTPDAARLRRTARVLVDLVQGRLAT